MRSRVTEAGLWILSKTEPGVLERDGCPSLRVSSVSTSVLGVSGSGRVCTFDGLPLPICSADRSFQEQCVSDSFGDEGAVNAPLPITLFAYNINNTYNNILVQSLFIYEWCGWFIIHVSCGWFVIHVSCGWFIIHVSTMGFRCPDRDTIELLRLRLGGAMGGVMAACRETGFAGKFSISPRIYKELQNNFLYVKYKSFHFILYTLLLPLSFAFSNIYFKLPVECDASSWDVYGTCLHRHRRRSDWRIPYIWCVDYEHHTVHISISF